MENPFRGSIFSWDKEIGMKYKVNDPTVMKYGISLTMTPLIFYAFGCSGRLLIMYILLRRNYSMKE